ncbi:ABC transporter substrate-binding protein [Microvirga tunisiensis]|uniref:ABC transporter substrate-binding protein n=2 Tax=Pannonibacter tanglangensis TaxID=2750084 RepID=A0ABW9ZC09_9HYPH|nr:MULTISPECIES: extracellular solute-binding protein [unclassified Pannonibacter]NBN62186.1 ABC transporter substrate-binding protein [Pannonibacter sp. XCT-34]NBN77854.1 ABC transporter substrate-binding protein [Pannonibacter sp. XCT-53]
MTDFQRNALTSGLSITRRRLLATAVPAALALPFGTTLFCGTSRANVRDPQVPALHGIAMHGEPALAPGFAHFPYANPDAPKGGVLTLGVQGTFDSLNSFIVQGGFTSARGMKERQFGENITESLLMRNNAEPFSLYAHLAEFVRMPDSREWIEFTLNPKATFSDGSPFTVDDVIFSLQIMRDKGRPPFRNWYAEIANFEVMGERTVRLTFKNGNNRELPLLIGLAPMFSKAATDAEAFDKSTLKPPLGTGPYVFAEIVPGRRVVYRRNPTYWAKDLPQKRGFDNFDEIRIEYFRDETSLQEAFRKGLIDVLPFNNPSRWTTGFDFPAAREGKVVRKEIVKGTPANMQGMAFNTRRPVFADRRVRQALSMLFDFEWVNRTLYSGLYKRTAGYWDNSDLSSIGRPADERERALLAPFPGVVLPEVLEGTWKPAETDGSGRDRTVLKAALTLLQDAGFSLKDRVLVDPQGQPVTFEIMTKNEDEEKLALAYGRGLDLVGIKASVRTVDASQFEERRIKFDFDMVFYTWTASLSPGGEQVGRWSQKAADTPGSLNITGAKEPAIDAMIDAMVAARSRTDFVSAVRALDRVLVSGAYAVPLFNLPAEWLGQWTRIVSPETFPLYGYEFPTWWSADAGN